jgi:hypothetical protein
MTTAAVTTGPMFRAINKAGRVAPDGFSPKVIWSVVNERLQPMRVARCCSA